MDTSSQNPNHNITVKDIAKYVGVSTSTVSRVLSGANTGMISEETRKRVMEAAVQLGYTPNAMARALKGKQTKLLGVIVREIADPFFASFIASLNTFARNLGYQIVLGHAHSDPQEAIQMSAVLDTRHLDGIFALGDLRDDNTALEQLLQSNRVVVAMCRGQKPSWIPKVNVDNFAGVNMLLTHLLQLGHHRVAFIDGGWLGDIRERRDAFEQYVKEHNLQPDFFCVEAHVNDADGGYAAMLDILSRSPRPTAIFAADDMMAIGALKAATNGGLSIPHDISVVGFDDIEMGRFVTPTLTTVRQPIEEMSRRAMELIVDLIEKRELTERERSIKIQPELVIRESSGPAPQI
jgi:DNA-binding LacI/PurR family transcriptional regulator